MSARPIDALQGKCRTPTGSPALASSQLTAVLARATMQRATASARIRFGVERGAAQP